MGYGDALMAAGQAQTIYDADPTAGPIVLADQHNRFRAHLLWRHNPVIAPKPKDGLRVLQTGENRLPYLHNPWSVHSGGWRFTDWRAADHRGKIYLTPDELGAGRQIRAAGGDYLLIDPPAYRKHVNRRPPDDLWPALVDQLRTVWRGPIYQLHYSGMVVIPGLEQLGHSDIREACGLLASARLLVTTEGGLAHCAAALGVPAVVCWGGNVSAVSLSYPEQVNLVDDSPETPCGRLTPCAHCRDAWARLTVNDICDGVDLALQVSA